MKPKIIELKQAPVVLVELGVDDVSYYNIDPFIRKGLEAEGYIFKDFLSDLTEEQFSECAIVFNQINGGVAYANYIMGTGEYSSKDFFYFLLESEGVYTENPYGGYEFAHKRHIVSGSWQEAQSRTIDPKRTAVLLRKEES